MERFTGRRWNGAEWNRLESAKSGPSPADVSLEAASGDSSAVGGSRGRLSRRFDVFCGLLCKPLILNAIYLHKSFCMDSQCPTGSARIRARLANWAKRKEKNMATLRFKRFTKVHFLKGVGRKLLARFFERFTGELAGKRVELPNQDLPDDEYFRGLSKLLLSPDGLPDELSEALFAIDEMANDAGQERLQNAVAQSKVEMEFELESSQGDVAMQVWLARPELFAATHNEQRLRRLSSFEYFGAKPGENKRTPFAAPRNEAMEGLRADLDSWFAEHNRGHETTQISRHEIDGEWWFVIRHGDTFSRTAKVERQKMTFLHFRPAKDDVVVFSPGHDELRIHATTKGERELYRKRFGVRLRGDDKYFSERKSFTLEPLRLEGAGALKWGGDGDVDGIVLREIEIVRGGGCHDVIIHKADDIFASAEAGREKAFPDGGELVRAAFDVHFAGMKKPRRVEVRPPNILKLGRRCDAAVVQKWLSERRFREKVTAGNGGAAPLALHGFPQPAPVADL
jgi:hypothetical protein